MKNSYLKLMAVTFAFAGAAQDVSALTLLPKKNAKSSSQLNWERVMKEMTPRLGLSKGSGEYDRGRVIAHCNFSTESDERFENIDIRIYKNSSLGTSLRSAEIVRTDALGNELDRKNVNYVFSKRVRKESAGAFGEAFTAAQLLGISQADSVMFYGVDMNLQKPIGLAVVHDVDDDPIDRFVLLGQKVYRCEGSEDTVRGCVQE